MNKDTSSGAQGRETSSTWGRFGVFLEERTQDGVSQAEQMS